MKSTCRPEHDSHTITDCSNDRQYFVIAPRLVWALSRSPYDYTLWCIIKDIAGETGECYISTPQLASLSMMSVGKVSQCRKHLLECGLLQGEIRRDPDYPQPVWHLRVPDLWQKNLDWCKQHPGIADRLEYKQSFHLVKAQEPSLPEKDPSPGEKGPSPPEKGPSPGETKKNHIKTKEEEKEYACIWQKVLNDLIFRLPPNVFTAHIRPTALIALTEATATVQCPTASLPWLDLCLRPLVEETLSRVLGRSITAIFTAHQPSP